MKMRTENSKWIIEETDKLVIFDNLSDAWQYIFLMKEIRTLPQVSLNRLYPVRSLIPTFAIQKKVVFVSA